jgi:hypothetical protein
MLPGGSSSSKCTLPTFQNEELKHQLEDFDKLSQVHLRNLSHAPTEKSDKEIKDLKEKYFILIEIFN